MIATLVYPIRGLDGKSRLSEAVDAEERRSLVMSMALRSVEAGREAGLDVMVVTASDVVIGWAHSVGVAVVEDPDEGLDAACRNATERLGSRPWIIAHADLPLVTPRALRLVVAAMERGTVLAPSRDGGTSVIGHSGSFPFAYGPGSFERHLASAPHATVLSVPELAIDLDGAADLAALTALGLRPTLAS